MHCSFIVSYMLVNTLTLGQYCKMLPIYYGNVFDK